jgi:hypothetical protein
VIRGALLKAPLEPQVMDSARGSGWLGLMAGHNFQAVSPRRGPRGILIE